MARKQDLVPKTGKGKYDVTVPKPFEFLNAEKSFTIRQQKFEQMMEKKKKDEEKQLRTRVRAREVPASVKANKYEKMLKAQEEKREDAKRLSMARTKAKEAPFNFHERDVQAQKEKLQQAELPQSYANFTPFRAKKIPWRVLVPLYKTMVDDADNERVKRIKKQSQVSMSLSKLPPRMEAHQKKVEDKAQQDLTNGLAQGPQFAFKPPISKKVPDFKRIHKEFAAKLERNKSAMRLTVPKAFNFHEPKNDPTLRKHMDAENQVINPTMRQRRARSAKLNRDLLEGPVSNPPTTKKHQAMVEHRRQTAKKKLDYKKDNYTADYVRGVKAVRLTGRVKQSPVFVNNAQELKQKRANSMQRFRDQT